MSNYPSTPSFGMPFGMMQNHPPPPPGYTRPTAHAGYPPEYNNGDTGFPNSWANSGAQQIPGMEATAAMVSMTAPQNAYAFQQNMQRAGTSIQSNMAFPFAHNPAEFQMMNTPSNGMPHPQGPFPLPSHQNFHPQSHPLPPYGGFGGHSRNWTGQALPYPPAGPRAFVGASSIAQQPIIGLSQPSAKDRDPRMRGQPSESNVLSALPSTHDSPSKAANFRSAAEIPRQGASPSLPKDHVKSHDPRPVIPQSQQANTASISSYKPITTMAPSPIGNAISHTGDTLMKYGSGTHDRPSAQSAIVDSANTLEVEFSRENGELQTRVRSTLAFESETPSRATLNSGGSTVAESRDILVNVKSSQPYTSTKNRSISELRRLAMSAILNLHPFRISFSELLAEGIHEDTLRSLFAELRLNCPPKMTTAGPLYPRDDAGSAANGSVSTPVSIPPGSIKLTPKRLDAESASNGSVSKPVSVPPSSTKLTPKLSDAESAANVSVSTPVSVPPNSTKLTTKLTEPKLSKGEEAASDHRTPSATKASASNLGSANTSTAIAKSPVSTGPKLERKDLIAQKLAARATKRSAPEKTDISASPHSTKPQEHHSSEAQQPGSKPEQPPRERPESKKSIPAQESRPVSQDTSAEKPPPPPTTTTTATTQTKIDQNELIRQRLATLQKAKERLPIPSLQDVAGSSVTQPTKVDFSRSGDGLSQTSKTVARLPGLSQDLSPVDIITSPSLDPTGLSHKRKRPVAADFDSEPSAPQTVTKRPFGHSRVDQPLVIEVSEEDSEGSINDSDEVLDSTAPVGRTLSGPGRSSYSSDGALKVAVRDMPPLPDLPLHRHSFIKKQRTAPNSGVNTPPPSLNSAAQGDLKRKEKEIQLMQKRIADLERRKFKQAGDGSDSPLLPNPLLRSSAINSRSASAERISTTAEIDRLINDTHRQMEQDKERLADAQPVDLEGAQSQNATTLTPSRILGKTSEADKSQQRRAELQAILRQHEAQVESERLRLEELRKEQERRQATVQHALAEKLRLIGELDILDRGASEALADEVKPENREMAVPTKLVATSKTVPDLAAAATKIIQQVGVSSTATGEIASSVHARAASASSAMDMSSDDNDGDNGVVDELVQSTVSNSPVMKLSQDQQESMLHATNEEESAEEGEISEDCEEAEDKPRSPLPQTIDPTAPAVGVLVAVAPPPIQSSIPSLPCEMEDSVMEDAGDCPPAEEIGMHGQQSARHGFAPKDSATAPLGDCIALSKDVPPAIDALMVDAPLPSMDSPGSDQSDPYEPPEPMATAGQASMNTESTNSDDIPESPPFSPASPESSDPAADPRNVVPIGVIDDNKVTNEASQAEAPTRTPWTSENRATDPVSLVEAAASAPLTLPQTTRAGSAQKEEYFTPYASPLKRFRSFRYHTDYLQDVSDGFRSLTYNHLIDPTKPVCRFEASGGICNDNSCEGQHFRDMKLKDLALNNADSEALLQIGSVNEGRNPQQKAAYSEGLRINLQDLRKRGVNDLDAVGKAIVEYRSRFLEDPSRVLNLDVGHG